MEPIYDDTGSIPTKHLHQNTKTVYANVMEGTLSKVREAFYDEGLDDQILNELRSLWDMKLQQSCVIANDNYAQPNYTKTDPNVERKLNLLNQQLDASRQLDQQVQQSSSQIQRQIYTRPDGVQVHHIPQYHLDGQNDESGESNDEKPNESENSSSSSSDTNDIDSNESEVKSESSVKSDQVESLNSNDDISDEEFSAFQCDNNILCQFESVKRKQQKWNVKLLNGIMNVNGKDIVFTKLTGEAEW